MANTPDNRFQISCSVCGLISGERTLKEALRVAKLTERRHSEPDEFVEVYDIMAHIGKPELFTSSGEVTKIRTN